MTASAETSASHRAEVIFRAIAEAADNAGLGVSIVYVRPGDEVEYAYFNRATEALLGYSAEEIRSRPVWSLFDTAEGTRMRALHRGRQRGEELPPVVETTVVRKDGSRLPVEFSTSRVVLEGQKANVSFLFDVTHRRQAEEALRASESRFRSVIEGAPDGVVLLRWPTVLYCNTRAARMWGFTDPAQAVGKDVTTLIPAEEGARAGGRAAQLKRHGHLPGPDQYSGRDPDGRPLTVEVSSIPIEYEGDTAVLAFVRDVTERNAMMASLMEADKLAAVGTLSAGVAHEINNPLAYLILNLDFVARELPRLTQDPTLLSRLQERLREAQQGAERVKTIVRDLQAFTRKDEDIRGPVELDAVIDTAMHMARHELRQRARLVRNFEHVPAVHGNATRLEQLFLNLLINAAHAIDEGGKTDNRIEVSLRAGPNRTVIAEVKDTGSGMDEAVRARAFDPFFTTKKTGLGTGLGLAICKGIVSAVGGRIQLDSAPGRGTTVRVELDCHSAEPDAAPSPGPRQPASRGRGRVLVVDDERAVAQSLAEALGGDNEVVVALTASAARDALFSDPPFDAVLCDLAMPGESGMALYEHMGTERPELQERFVFMTGGAFHPDAQDFLERSLRPCVEKPFDLRKLRELIERTIERARGPSRPPP